MAFAEELRKAMAILVNAHSTSRFAASFGADRLVSSDDSTSRLTGGGSCRRRYNAQYNANRIRTVYTHLSARQAPYYSRFGVRLRLFMTKLSADFPNAKRFVISLDL